jgi:hypothetical protein
MDDYNSYVTAVNKIFDYIEKMKAAWDSLDNKNYISSIEEYKNAVISKAEAMKKPPTAPAKKEEAATTEVAATAPIESIATEPADASTEQKMEITPETTETAEAPAEAPAAEISAPAAPDATATQEVEALAE